MSSMRDIADRCNEALAAGGQVHVGTMTRVTVYKKRHAGMFFVGESGALRVKSGRGSVCLSLGAESLLVRIRIFGEAVAS